MRLFLSEYLCSGALAEAPLTPSLLREGRAMRDALASDLIALPGVSVVTTSDPRTPPAAEVESVVVRSSAEERREFERLCRESDATLIIAPELDGQLTLRGRIAADLSLRPLNSHPETIELCADKWALAEHLARSGVRSVRTELVTGGPKYAGEVLDRIDTDPVVLKPRRGAGSQSTWLCHNRQQLERRLREFHNELPAEEPVLQPFVAGQALSVAALFDLDSCQLREVWPVAEQHLSTDGRFQYLGGRIPAADVNREAIEQFVRDAAATIKGLRGYVGFDLIVPEEDPSSPVLIEINPRLTTSYVGYRRLSRENLADALLGRTRSAPQWQPGPVQFAADGSPA